ncbi:MAG: VOC family protein [Sphingomonadaceae bacterium]
MSVELNHTIVWSSDKEDAARFFSEMYGLAEPIAFGRFLVVQTANGVSMDFADKDGPIAPQHYAFLVGEGDFDAIFARIRERGISHWADPARQKPGEINRNDGGRGVYFEGPDGHFYEALTVPYGGGDAA